MLVSYGSVQACAAWRRVKARRHAAARIVGISARRSR